MSFSACDKDTMVIFRLRNGCTLVWHRSLFGSVLVAQWSDISHILVVYWLRCGHSLVVSENATSCFLVVTTLLRVYKMTLWQCYFPTLLWRKSDFVAILWQCWNFSLAEDVLMNSLPQVWQLLVSLTRLCISICNMACGNLAALWLQILQTYFPLYVLIKSASS